MGLVVNRDYSSSGRRGIIAIDIYVQVQHVDATNTSRRDAPIAHKCVLLLDPLTPDESLIYLVRILYGRRQPRSEIEYDIPDLYDVPHLAGPPNSVEFARHS